MTSLNRNRTRRPPFDGSVAPSLTMRLALASLLGLAFASLALAASTGRVIASNGVRLVVPAGWQRVHAANPGAVVDPRILLVVGTAGVRPRASHCQIAAYRVPAGGAVVVVVGWRSVAAAGGTPKPGRAPLGRLVAVRAHSAECFAGRAAAADVNLGGKLFQVNVMVGARASKLRVAEALTVARSFDRGR
jgi:hypothetical protein